MQMLSTRGAAAVSPSKAILRGLAPDGVKIRFNGVQVDLDPGAVKIQRNHLA